MGVTIPDEILQAARMTNAEMVQEVALMLYQKRKLSLGKARHLAGVCLADFFKLLGSRRIPINYDVEDLEQDMKTLRDMGRLGDNPGEKR